MRPSQEGGRGVPYLPSPVGAPSRALGDKRQPVRAQASTRGHKVRPRRRQQVDCHAGHLQAAALILDPAPSGVAPPRPNL